MVHWALDWMFIRFSTFYPYKSPPTSVAINSYHWHWHISLSIFECIKHGFVHLQCCIEHHVKVDIWSALQILAYLLMSASSSAATRVTDWISNWGKDEFTLMASASIAVSFLAFLAFASSSLISGYNLCSRDSSWSLSYQLVISFHYSFDILN